jgi:serine/threonine protein kinase
MALTTGQILHNRYRVVKLIGQGGFGAVYRGWHLSLNHACAIKENFDTSPEAQRQFEREAQMLSALRHRNLPVVVDHFVEPGLGQYLVMDYVEGEDLQAMLDGRGVLTEQEVLPWIGQVCDALDYLHNRPNPIIHRDIKPANIKITPDGRAMLVDFGLAKAYNPQLKTTVGAQGVTPGFSPWEQYGKGSTTARSDIYSLGATLYALLTGTEPPESLYIMGGGATLTPPQQLKRSLSPHVAAAIVKAMESAPDKRFGSAAELKAALLAAPAGRPVQPRPTQQPTYQTALPAVTHSSPYRPPAPPPVKSVVQPKRLSPGIIIGLGLVFVFSTLSVPLLFRDILLNVATGTLTPNLAGTSSFSVTATINAALTSVSSSSGTGAAGIPTPYLTRTSIFGGTGVYTATSTRVSTVPMSLPTTSTSEPTRQIAITTTVTATSLPITVVATIELLSNPTLDPNSSSLIQVVANQSWQNSPVQLLAGQEFAAEYISGLWTYWTGGIPPFDANGDNHICTANNCCEMLPRNNKGSLIGKIGSDIFLIGNGGTFLSPAEGTLLLRMNDCDTDLDDNSGYVQIRITP